MLGGAALTLPLAIPRAARAALPVPPGDALAFQLVRLGSVIGKHTVAFVRDGEALTVTIDVDVLVKLGFIPLVRYTHHAVETWQGDTFTGLTSATDKNGPHYWVRARTIDGALHVESSSVKPYVAPPDALATTYWNGRMLDGPMIGTQDGMLVRPKIVDDGRKLIPLASGARIAAEQYDLSGAFTSTVWYDDSSEWAGIQFSVADGSVITYQRL